MKASKGQANPPMVNKILLEEIKNDKSQNRLMEEAVFVDGYDRVLSQIQTTAVYQFIGSFYNEA